MMSCRMPKNANLQDPSSKKVVFLQGSSPVAMESEDMSAAAAYGTRLKSFLLSLRGWKESSLSCTQQTLYSARPTPSPRRTPSSLFFDVCSGTSKHRRQFCTSGVKFCNPQIRIVNQEHFAATSYLLCASGQDGSANSHTLPRLLEG